MAEQQTTLEELGGTVQSAAARLMAAQGMHPTMAVALAPFAPPPESETDRAIRILTRDAERLTDWQLTRIGDVFREALCSAEDGEVCRRYNCDGLAELLAEAREYDPEPIGPDYSTLDAPYMTEREQDAVADRAAHAYGASRLGEAAR